MIWNECVHTSSRSYFRIYIINCSRFVYFHPSRFFSSSLSFSVLIVFLQSSTFPSAVQMTSSSFHRTWCWYEYPWTNVSNATYSLEISWISTPNRRSAEERDTEKIIERGWDKINNQQPSMEMDKPAESWHNKNRTHLLVAWSSTFLITRARSAEAFCFLF